MSTDETVNQTIPVASGQANAIAPPANAPETLTAGWARQRLPKREVGTHKWEVGGLLVIGGAPTYVGAAGLAAMAAQRGGAGIVRMAVPRSIVGPLVGLVPEATFVLLPETESLTGARQAVVSIREAMADCRAVLIGPGLGDDEAASGLLRAFFGTAETARPATQSLGFNMPIPKREAAGETVVPEVAERDPKPMVIDADGLNWLAAQEDWPSLLTGLQAVLTPHPGELGRLAGIDTAEVVADPVGQAVTLARRSGQVVVSKYGQTVVTDGTTVLIAPSATPALATAGTGDVLAGTIAAFLTQGLSPVDAAGLAVYLGATAAETLVERTGILGLIASDLPLAIAGQIASLERSIGQGRVL